MMSCIQRRYQIKSHLYYEQYSTSQLSPNKSDFRCNGTSLRCCHHPRFRVFLRFSKWIAFDRKSASAYFRLNLWNMFQLRAEINRQLCYNQRGTPRLKFVVGAPTFPLSVLVIKIESSWFEPSRYEVDSLEMKTTVLCVETRDYIHDRTRHHGDMLPPLASKKGLAALAAPAEMDSRCTCTWNEPSMEGRRMQKTMWKNSKGI